MKQEITTALFEITNACNLNCIHCYRENRGGKELSLKQIKIIIEKITASGVDSLILTGGEPLLRKDLFEILHNKNIGCLEYLCLGIRVDGDDVF